MNNEIRDTQTNLYRRWIDMKGRCYNPNCNNYKHYGARGIIVCDEWLHNFKAFKEWAMNNGYRKELSLDRIDNNGNYEPMNCRWVSQTIQCINMRHKNTSGYVGICLHTDGKHWYGRVKFNKKCVYTGMSLNILDAVKMRNDYILANNLPNKLNEI